MTALEQNNFLSAQMQIASLWVLVVVTAISVAYVSHLCREKYAELVMLEGVVRSMQNW